MRGLRRALPNRLRLAFVPIWNALLFAALILWHGTPPRLWRRAWAEAHAEHLAYVRKLVWEAKKAGLIYEDREGRLYGKKKQK